MWLKMALRSSAPGCGDQGKGSLEPLLVPHSWKGEHCPPAPSWGSPADADTAREGKESLAPVLLPTLLPCIPEWAPAPPWLCYTVLGEYLLSMGRVRGWHAGLPLL